MASIEKIFEQLNDAVLWGEEEDAAEFAQQALDVGGQEATHFMLAPGCEITGDTPAENIQAYVDAAKG